MTVVAHQNFDSEWHLDRMHLLSLVQMTSSPSLNWMVHSTRSIWSMETFTLQWQMWPCILNLTEEYSSWDVDAISFRINFWGNELPVYTMHTLIQLVRWVGTRWGWMSLQGEKACSHKWTHTAYRMVGWCGGGGGRESQTFYNFIVMGAMDHEMVKCCGFSHG